MRQHSRDAMANDEEEQEIKALPPEGCGFALSTVGVSAYNWLAAIRRRPATPGEILAGVRAEWCAEVSDQELHQALEIMLDRGYIKVVAEAPEPTFDVKDPHRWVVIARPGKQPFMTDDDGWDDWRLMPAPAQRPRRIYEVIG